MHHRLTDFLEDDGLSDADMSENEAENEQQRLYWEEEVKITRAEAKLDPNWKPKQNWKKRKVTADSEGKEKGEILMSLLDKA
jgi:hypothetical protein